MITGFGRTSCVVAAEHFALVPDIMTITGAIGYRRLAPIVLVPDVFTSEKHRDALLYLCGQAVAAAAALKNIEIMKPEELCLSAAEHGLTGRRTG